MTTTNTNAATTRDEGQDDPSALTIELSPELRQRIEAAAARRDVSLQAYVEEVLQHAAPVSDEHQQAERHPISREAYEQLTALRERLARAYPCKVFPDSVEVIRQMREERTQHLETLMTNGW